MRGMVMNMEHYGNEGAIEWEDTMFMMNQMHNSLMMSWFIEDRKTGKRNMDIMAKINKGDIKMIRITNEKIQSTPCPIIYGQRF